ncbi:hypothetical protein PENTCL1PPCAC_10732, partial [Pristionchus entomophagus]
KMAPNISYVYYKERPIAENNQLSLNFDQKQLLLVNHDDRENIYPSEDIHSLEWCFHESGPLGSSKFEAFAVLQFTSSQRIFDHQIDAYEPVVLVVGNAFVDFISVQVMVIHYQRVFTPNVVKLLPFTKFPDCVKRVLPNIANSLTRKLRDQMKEKEGKGNSKSDCIQIDDENGPEAPARRDTHYNIGGTQIEISERGIQSLGVRRYMNDEAMNAALTDIQNRYPFAHIFDTFATAKIFETFQEKEFETSCSMPEEEYNRHFGQFFLKRSSYESRPISETFFAKKMLMFTVNHIKHWYLVVVVNPLLGDINNYINRDTMGHRATAYYVDSLIGTKKYTHDLMSYRLSVTWKSIFSFLRLGALYHAHSFLHAKLITCQYETNIPSQGNNYDCGPHTIVNARLMAERFDQLVMGPEVVEISEEEEDRVVQDVEQFRETFKDYLDTCKIRYS